MGTSPALRVTTALSGTTELVRAYPVTLRGPFKGCLWLCFFCLNDDVFISEAGDNPIFDNNILKCGMKSFQTSLTEIKSVLRPTPERDEKHDNENSLSREVNKISLVKERRSFN